MSRLLCGSGLALLGACLALAPAAGADDKKADRKVESPQEFVTLASAAGLAEVNFGKLAADKASNDAVKKFGQHMVDDHSKANQELLDIATRKKWTPAAQMDDKHKTEWEKLAKMSGSDFDREFMADMVADHKDAVALFEAQSQNGMDDDLKAFASKTLPTIRHHLETAQKLADAPKEKDAPKDKDGKDR